MVQDHGVTQLLADLKLLGYSEVILKCDGEPALKAVQEEVKRRFEGTAISENSPVGERMEQLSALTMDALDISDTKENPTLVML